MAKWLSFCVAIYYIYINKDIVAFLIIFKLEPKISNFVLYSMIAKLKWLG